MKPTLLAIFIAAGLYSSSTLAQRIDCSPIRNNPPSYKKCLDAQREAAIHEKEKIKQQRRARARELICVADKAGDKAAAVAAGWAGRIVYKGTRAAADAISKGASRCPS